MVRICIDAREVRDVETGVGRYAFSLVRAIARLDQHNEYLLLRRAAYPRPLWYSPILRTSWCHTEFQRAGTSSQGPEL